MQIVGDILHKKNKKKQKIKQKNRKLLSTEFAQIVLIFNKSKNVVLGNKEYIKE